jgi:hypothetical protein
MNKNLVFARNFFIGAACLAAFCASLSAAGVTPYEAGKMFGYCLTISSVIWWSAFANAKMRGAKRIGFPAFAMIFGVLYGAIVVASHGARQKRIENQKAMMSSLQTCFLETYGSLYDSNGISRIADTKLESIPKASGFMGEFELFAKENINKFVEARNKYVRELEEAKWFAILEPARIGSDATFAESREMLKKAEACFVRYTNNVMLVLSSIESSALKLNMDELGKQQFIAGLKRSQRDGLAHLRAVFQCEKDSLAAIKGMVEFLAADPNAWIIENDTMSFYDDEPLEKYIALSEALDGIAIKQEKLEQNRFLEVNKNFEKLLK